MKRSGPEGQKITGVPLIVREADVPRPSDLERQRAKRSMGVLPYSRFKWPPADDDRSYVRARAESVAKLCEQAGRLCHERRGGEEITCSLWQLFGPPARLTTSQALR